MKKKKTKSKVQVQTKSKDHNLVSEATQYRSYIASRNIAVMADSTVK